MGLCEARPPSTLPPVIERSGAQLRAIDEFADSKCIYDQDVMAPDAELDQ